MVLVHVHFHQVFASFHKRFRKILFSNVRSILLVCLIIIFIKSIHIVHILCSSFLVIATFNSLLTQKLNILFYFWSFSISIAVTYLRVLYQWLIFLLWLVYDHHVKFLKEILASLKNIFMIFDLELIKVFLESILVSSFQKLVQKLFQEDIFLSHLA